MSLVAKPPRIACLMLVLLAPAGGLLDAVGPATRRIPPKPLLKVEEHHAFYVAGLARRTNNAREMAGVGEIAKLWQEFQQKHVENEIARKLDNDLLAVYTDYESDQHGDYTYLLGKRVPDLRDLPAGLTGRYVPAGRYAELVSEKGPVTEVVPKMWQRIWSMRPLEMGGRRAFEADYELYDERAKDPRDAQVDLFIGLQ